MKAITDPTKLPSANKDIARFLAKIEVSTERFWNGTPCWEWSAKRNEDGYGWFRLAGQAQGAHRAAYKLLIGEPGKLHVLHRCDNPPCVNPAHLWLGTNLDNIHDRDAKGRQVALRGDQHYARTNPERLARGERHGSRTKPEKLSRGKNHGWYTKPESRLRGEKNGNSKLKDADIPRIRELRQQGFKLKEIAATFNVSLSLIGKILKGQTRKHI